MSFEAIVRSVDHLAVLDLHGEINSQADQALDTAYVQAEATDPKAVLLNFSDVTYINSTGIALIVSLLARARKTSREVRAFGLSDHYREIFEITRLADFMDMFPDETAAAAKQTEEVGP